MGERQASTLFLRIANVDAVDRELTELLDEENYRYGAMKRIPIATLAPAIVKGWTVVVPETEFDFLARPKEAKKPRLAELAARLECDGFQLDVSDYSVGLVEVNKVGQWIETGLMNRDTHGNTPAPLSSANEASFDSRYLLSVPRELRRRLRSNSFESEEKVRFALDLGRALCGKRFDARDDDHDFDDATVVEYRMP